MGASDAKRSCPAVSHISNLIVRVGRLHFCVRKAATGTKLDKPRTLQQELSPIPPMVGSLFSWKSLFTNRSTREDCTISQSAKISLQMHNKYLSNCCFTKEDELHAAAWLGCCCLRHPEGNVRVDDRF